MFEVWLSAPRALRTVIRSIRDRICPPMFSRRQLAPVRSVAPSARLASRALAPFILLGVMFSAAPAFAQTAFSSVTLGAGNFDTTIGLNSNKTYLNAVNLTGSAITIGANGGNLGVTFAASNAANPSGSNWSTTNWGNQVNSGQSTVTGNLGTLLNTFNYGDGSNPQTLTLTSLTAGKTYDVTFYNRDWDNTATRSQLITTSSGGSTTFQQDLAGTGGQNQGNLLRYTFVASGASEVITMTPQQGGSWHLYGFSTEQVFNNTFTSGTNWSTSVWANTANGTNAIPTTAGSNAIFGSSGSPATLNLDANETVGHLQFNGAVGTTISGASTLTLQGDTGGVSMVNAFAGTHTISTQMAFANNVNVYGGGALNLSGNISGTGALSFQGANAAVGYSGGSLALSGTNSYSGGTTVNGGTLSINADAALGAVPAAAATNLTFGGNSTLQAGASGIGVGFTRNVQINSGVTATIDTQANPMAIGGAIGGSGSLNKIGSGVLMLANTNTYSGSTTVNGGTLRLGHSSTLGTGAVANAGSYTFSAATGNLLAGLSPASNTNGSGGLESTGAVTMLTNGAIVANNANTYTIGNNAVLTYILGSAFNGYDISKINIYSGWGDSGRENISLNSIKYSTVANPTSFTNTFPNSAINYEGGTAVALSTLTATGGTLADNVYAIQFNFGNQENNYVGYRELEVVGATASSPPTGALAAGSAVNLAVSGAAFDIYDNNQTIASLTGVAGANVRLGKGVLTVGDNTTTTFAGVIGDSGGASSNTGGSLVKQGAGTVTLSGANVYTGATTIKQGVLQVASGGSLAAASAVAVGGSTATGTPTLMGSGTVSGAVTVNGAGGGAAGHLAPGLNVSGNTGAIGTLNVGSLTLNSGAVLDYDFGGSLNSDLTTMAGVLTLPTSGAVTLNLTSIAGGLGNNSYKLFTYGSVANFSSTIFTVGSSPLTGRSYSFTNTGTELDLTIATQAWLGTTSGDWETGTNWVAGSIPGSTSLTTNTDTATFNGASGNRNVVVNANRNVQFLVFDNPNSANAYTISAAGGSSILLTNNGGIQTTANEVNTSTVNAPLVIEGAAATFTSGSPSAALKIGGGIIGLISGGGTTTLTLNGANGGLNVISGVIGDNGSTVLALVKNQAGTWILSNANTYTGGTTISNGILQLGDGTTNGSVAGTILNNSALVFKNGASQTFAGVISGSGTVSVNNAAALNLTGANTYSGGTTISGGTLNINADAALGAVPGSPATNLTFAASGTLQAGASGTVLYSTRSITVASAAIATIDTQANAMMINGESAAPDRSSKSAAARWRSAAKAPTPAPQRSTPAR